MPKTCATWVNAWWRSAGRSMLGRWAVPCRVGDDLRLVGLKLIFLTVSRAVSLLGLSRRESWWKDAEILMLRHRDRAGPRPVRADDAAVAAAGDVGAADLAQVAAGQPGAGAQAGQRRGAHPPAGRGLGGGQGEEPGDLHGAVGLPGALAGQRRVGRVQVRDDPPAQEPQAGAQRAPAG